MIKDKPVKKIPRQTEFDGRERKQVNWTIFKDQGKAIDKIAKKTTGGNVQVALRNILDQFLGLGIWKKE